MDIFLSVYKYLLSVRSLVFPEYLGNSSEYNGLPRWLLIRIQSDPHAVSSDPPIEDEFHKGRDHVYLEFMT